jgi:hypothetical protein
VLPEFYVPDVWVVSALAVFAWDPVLAVPAFCEFEGEAVSPPPPHADSNRRIKIPMHCFGILKSLLPD